MVTAEERALGSTVLKEASREELAETTSDGEHFKSQRRYLLLSKGKEYRI